MRRRECPRLVEEVLRRVQALADHPDPGRLVPEFDNPLCGNSFLRRSPLCTGVVPDVRGLFASGAVNIYCIIPRLNCKHRK